MTSELRPAEEVATEVATALTKKPANDRTLGEYLAAVVIEADRAPLLAEIERLREALVDVTASLVAAISLLERGGKAVKKAAPSDLMFNQMVRDYTASTERARAALGDSHDA